MNNSINVTKTFLPPIKEYEEYLKQIWANNQLTNQGPLVCEFEAKMRERLDVKHFHFVTNGTLALQVAIEALAIKGSEIITTPFSYVATASAILWQHCDPIFVDINPKTFCIDESRIEQSITKNTKAIMPVHVFGNACNVEAVERIAKKHKLKVIYDGAHAFGVKYKNKELLAYGDISICSFHATKLFHTIEGGCLITNNSLISEKIDLIKKFGHYGDDHFCLGINAKASEFQAAMGLCNLKYTEEIIKNRKELTSLYDSLLGGMFERPVINKKINKYNWSYYPVCFKDEGQMLGVIKQLNEKGINPRRYFYPSLNTLPYLKTYFNCPVSEDISKRILCLPLYNDLSHEDIEHICNVMKKACSVLS